MVKSYDAIVLDILEFIHKEGGHPAEWHVGVTFNAGLRLFDEHQVHYQNDAWIYRTATSDGEARRVQAYFLALGMEGSEEEWRPGIRMIYVYRRSISTKP